MEGFKLYEVEDVAEMFSCTKETVYKLIKDGTLVGSKAGKCYKFSTDDIKAAHIRCQRKLQKAAEQGKPGRPRNPVPEIG